MKNWKTLIALLMAAVMIFAIAACGIKEEEKPAEEPEQQEQQEEQEEETEDDGMVELSEDQMDDLYQQAAEKACEVRYSEYMPDVVVGHAEPFHIEREGDKGTWDVYLGASEYVALDGKAYEVAGSYGEAILKFDYTDDGPKLTDLIWSADGGDHDQWIEENFNKEALENWENFRKDDEQRDLLIEIVQKNAEDALGVPVEKDLLLEIDESKGTYQIIKTIESGDPENGDYTFDTETVKEGKLEDLK